MAGTIKTIVISYRGPGIPPDVQPYIFDRFYKTQSEDNKTGSGLGLAIAKQIAERHAIEISVSSKSVSGAEFRFVFGDNLDELLLLQVVSSFFRNAALTSSKPAQTTRGIFPGGAVKSPFTFSPALPIISLSFVRK